MNFFETSDENLYQSFLRGKRIFVQDWQWGEFQKALGKDVHRFVLENNGAVVVAGQAIVNTLRGKKYLYFPYGPMADNPEHLREFLECLPGFDSAFVFVRIEPQLPLGSAAGNLIKSTDLSPHKTLILQLDKTEEDLFADMKPKTRYNIRIAGKKDLEIRRNENLEECAALIVATAKRAGIRALPADYYLKIFEFFGENAGKNAKRIRAEFYSAWQNGDILAANLIIFYEDAAFYLFGGSSDKKKNLMAPYLLHWHAIHEAKSAGLKYYDFWGVEEDENHPWHGFSRFKLGFGGRIEKYEGTYDYVFKKAWYNAYRVARKLNRILR